ncbi:MAG: hypothetical protein E6K18_06125 [Methanobacteriota archaeon]|nr:MAG: hypothetical protein E6K18_06125 [Euryarchaeota archaeon]
MAFRDAWRLVSLAGSVVALALVIFGILELVQGCAGSGLLLIGLAVLPVGIGSGSRQFTGIASAALFGLSALAYTAYGSC